jgi:hypothetical protein
MARKIKVTGPGDMGDFHARLAANLKRVQEDEDYRIELQSERVGNPITLGPRVVDADSWAEDMTTAAKNKAAKWLARSVKPKKDPKARARKASKKFESNMRAALDERRWDAGIEGYDEDLRIKTIEAVGESGYRAGIDTKALKIKARVAKLQPLVAALTATIDEMPVDTPEQRAAKMIAARDGMLAIKKEMRK